jgi:hypothetical protein
MSDQWEKFEKIAIIGNLIEAQLLESILKENQISFRIRSFHDTAYDGLFQLQKGWGELYGLLEQRDEILDILNSIRSGDAGRQQFET